MPWPVRPIALGVMLVLSACTAAPPPATPSGPPANSPPTPVPASPAATGAPAAGPETPPVATPIGTLEPTLAPATDGPPETQPPPAQLAWTRLSAGGEPGPREDHTWTVAPDGGAYLFGGRAGRREFADLWRYDLAADSWTRLEPAGDVPAARFGHTAVWVDGVGLVIWSGQAGPRFFADVWAYDPAANGWRQLPDGGDVPPARYGSCAGVGPDGRMWISHGFTQDTGRFSDTRAYDFGAGSWSDVTPAGDRPVERCLHDCLWTPDGQLVLYAGQTTGAPAIGDLWSYEPSTGTWVQESTPAPAARQLYALAALNGTAYVFGGADREAQMLDDLWLLDLADLAWTEAQPSGERPAGRFGATLIADPQRERLLLYGGKGDEGELADAWQLGLGR